MTESKTGWEREHRIHFDEITENYEKVRWDYPDQIFSDIITYTGANSKIALEIGAGTGKATAPFLNARYNVTAVELGENMSMFLQNKFNDNNMFDVITATFEDVLLDNSSYDLIYAASAFHWIDAQIGCPKVYRLLKPGGVFALIRNNVLPSDGEALFEEIQEAYSKHYYSFYTSKERWVNYTTDYLMSPAGIKHGFGFEDMRSFGFNDIVIKLYDKTITYDADKFAALMDTMSDHRVLPEKNREALYAGIKNAINNHGGQYSQNSIFTLYMGRK